MPASRNKNAPQNLRATGGEAAGTTGLSRRAEAIDVQILPTGQVPDGYDGSVACIVG